MPPEYPLLLGRGRLPLYNYIATLGHVRTLANRIRAIPDLASGNPKLRARGERIALSTVIQGGSRQ
jgi:DNA polymerase I-like protein with 3'-5' exonuclease and polymerase domains